MILSSAARSISAFPVRTDSSRHAALLRWLDEGAPADKDAVMSRAARIHPIAASGQNEPSLEACGLGQVLSDPTPRRRRRRDAAPPPSKPTVRSPLLGELDAVLSRGLASLPLDSKQRARARALARDGGAYFSLPVGTRRTAGSRSLRAVDAIAAAIAYAIVYVDHVPLTQSEVAACFRVSVANLRGRFGELRGHLDGDSRYRTLRG